VFTGHAWQYLLGRTGEQDTAQKAGGAADMPQMADALGQRISHLRHVRSAISHQPSAPSAICGMSAALHRVQRCQIALRILCVRSHILSSDSIMTPCVWAALGMSGLRAQNSEAGLFCNAGFIGCRGTDSV